jgi:class 3 adenylate cyclase
MSEETLSELREGWGTVEFTDKLFREYHPTLAEDPEFRSWFANLLRLGTSPAGAYAFNRMINEGDLRDVYPAIRVPTLVLHRHDPPEDRDAYRRVASLIPDVRVVELPGAGSEIFLDEPAREIEAFLCSLPARLEPDRMLVTVLFTDIVDSTDRLAELGDTGWREFVERHHGAVRRSLARFRGQEIDTAGDGFFATFDGPARAIRCARSVSDDTRGLGIEVRTGIHTGECEIIDGKPGGLGVNIGARLSALARPGEVLVSGTVKDLVAGSGIAFEERGEHELKGVPGTWRLYAVVDG